MAMETLMGHVGHGIGLILLLSMPAVLLAAGIGLIVGILQAVTQVQEQTIAAAPKIFLVFMLVIFGGPFMMDVLQDYLRESLHLGMEVIPRDELMVLPPKSRMAYGEANSRLDFFKEKRRIPTESKVKRIMESPTPVGKMAEQNAAVETTVSQPRPKASVGEKLYVKRRSNGTLPNPPNKREY